MWQNEADQLFLQDLLDKYPTIQATPVVGLHHYGGQVAPVVYSVEVAWRQAEIQEAVRLQLSSCLSYLLMPVLGL